MSEIQVAASALLEKVLKHPGIQVRMNLNMRALGNIEFEEDSVFHIIRQRETTLTMDLHVVDDVGKALLLDLVRHSEAQKVVETMNWRRA